MTATDELRRMLDERGVEWKNETAFMQGKEHLMTTWKSMDGKTVAYSEFEYPHMKKLRIYDCTPEQAIAATLGAGTCRDTGNYVSAFECDTCGEVYEMYRTPSFCPSCGRAVRA